MNMADFTTSMQAADNAPLTEREQQRMGVPVGGKLSPEHLAFLKEVKRLIETKEIDPYDPKTFLKKDVYDSLNEEWIEKTDLALANIAGLLRQVYELFVRKDTPDESPQYQTMIEQLWDMKQRIEQHHDVFKF